MFHAKILIDSSLLTLVCGIVLFLMITKGKYTPEKFKEEYSKLRFTKKIARLAILAISILPVLGLFHLISYDNIIVAYFFKGILRCFVICFILIKLIPFFYFKCGCDVEGDLLKYAENESFLKFNVRNSDLMRNEYL